MKKPLIVAIDGPAGSGKTSVSRRLALHLRLPCLDTGAMYRRVALEAMRTGIRLNDEEGCCRLARAMRFSFGLKGDQFVQSVTFDDGRQEPLGSEIRTPEVSMGASAVGIHKELRKILVAHQQELGRANGAVVEGRDAGTAIFPETPYKFYITATPEERAKRRFEELKSIPGMTFEKVFDDVKQRDLQDSSRASSPLARAQDAEVVDTTGTSVDVVVAKIVAKIQPQGS